jgi:hypothetical protein
VATIASGSIGLSFVLSIIAFIQLQSAENRVINVEFMCILLVICTKMKGLAVIFRI